MYAPTDTEAPNASLASGVVPELLIQEISLRFSGVKTSAISPCPRLAVQPLPPAGMRSHKNPGQGLVYIRHLPLRCDVYCD